MNDFCNYCSRMNLKPFIEIVYFTKALLFSYEQTVRSMRLLDLDGYVLFLVGPTPKCCSLAAEQTTPLPACKYHQQLWQLGPSKGTPSMHQPNWRCKVDLTLIGLYYILILGVCWVNSAQHQYALPMSCKDSWTCGWRLCSVSLISVLSPAAMCRVGAHGIILSLLVKSICTGCYSPQHEFLSCQ